MKFSVEILDHIFSFLESQHWTLRACSEDPVLSPIVERHFYSSLIVHIDNRCTDPYYTVQPHQLSKLVAENPRIPHHVRLLEIRTGSNYSESGQEILPYEEFTKTLTMFPALESILLTSSYNCMPRWPEVFRAALEDRLNIPTIERVDLIGIDLKEFPISLLDNCKNIKKLCLLGTSGEARDFVEALPKLQSLTLSTGFIPPSFLAWIKLNIKGLESLKCGFALSHSGQKPLAEFLGVCSQTLTELDIDLAERDYESVSFPMEAEPINPLVEFSPLPPNLRQLTIRARLSLGKRLCHSLLPSVAETISLFISSVKHLVLDIDISLGDASLADVDFSPLAILGAASLSIPHIDMYIHTGCLPSAMTHAQSLSSLGKYDVIARAIKGGILVIHPEETAPECV